MIAGHFATALIPKARHPELSMAWLLAAANLPDFLWLVLGFAGVEAPIPRSLLNASFANIIVEMTYSHDVISVFILAAVFSAFVMVIKKDRLLAFWCGGLVVFHLLCDLVSGYQHHIWGPQTPAVGLATYTFAPHAALLIEAALSSFCIFYYDRQRRLSGRPLSTQRQVGLLLTLVGGVLIWWPTAITSLAELLEIS
jgi:hypothetical protein